MFQNETLAFKCLSSRNGTIRLSTLAFHLTATLFLFGCSSNSKTPPCSRAPASSGLSCSQFVPSSKYEVASTFSRSAELFAKHLDALQKEVAGVRSLEEFEAIHSREIQRHLLEGQEKFLDDNHQLIFRDQMTEVLGASGARRAAVYTANQNGKNYFVKQLRADRSDESLLQEVQNAKLLALLGISPPVEIVRSNNITYLVMEKAPGINIKEVLVPVTRTNGTKERIDQINGFKSRSVDEAARSFSLTMLSNPDYEARLQEIVEILTAFNYTNTTDLQFMVDLNIGPSSIQIIDSEDFKRNTPASRDTPTAARSVRYFLLRLRQLAR